jgi:hypothetical protein
MKDGGVMFELSKSVCQFSAPIGGGKLKNWPFASSPAKLGKLADSTGSITCGDFLTRVFSLPHGMKKQGPRQTESIINKAAGR